MLTQRTQSSIQTCLPVGREHQKTYSLWPLYWYFSFVLPAYRQLPFGHIFSIVLPSFFKRSDEKRRRGPRGVRQIQQFT